MKRADWLAVGKEHEGKERWRLALACLAAWSLKQQLILLLLPHQLSSRARSVTVTSCCSPTSQLRTLLPTTTLNPAPVFSAAPPAETRPSLISPPTSRHITTMANDEYDVSLSPSRSCRYPTTNNFLSSSSRSS
jgi:hypothetical protein